ncbi:hypothetical protein [Clostridium sp. YIM B02500]|uniref:hypothetical protein n=1 Tax=Clostridium sp. YIM B02500 TaxID=2910681 RepID=UPI001EEDEBF6|nr:hypothetical protein [Clostridium sp. YIM B02500]
MNSCKLLEVKAIVQNPYYKAPSWIDDKIQRREFVVLDEDSSENDVELFLIELLGYNNINIEQGTELVMKEVLAEDEIVIAGGMLFVGENRNIFPSCCCGLESWNEVLAAAIDKSSPWLGHDPYPCFEYVGNNIRIWSDDFKVKQSSEIYFVECDRDILIEKLKLVKNDLIKFSKGPLYNHISKHSRTYTDLMVQQFEKWFSLNLV